MTGVSITYLGDENFLLQLPHRSMTATTDELLMIRDAITAKLPTEIALRQGDYVEATMTVKTDPDTGTYYPEAVLKHAFPSVRDQHFKAEFDAMIYTTELQKFAAMYRDCKKRGMIE